MEITQVTRRDVALLDTALRHLSDVLGDKHKADLAGLIVALFSENPAIWAMLARDGDELSGAVVFSPAYSTVKGSAGLYVSDLWVGDGARGRGLGKMLLAAAASRAGVLWQAQYLKLAVYDSSPDAQRFYTRLAFAAQTDETVMILDGSGLQALKGT